MTKFTTDFDPVYATLADIPNGISEQEVIKAIKEAHFVLLPDGRTTICNIIMHNGWSMIGKAACFNPASYDKVKGDAMALKDAMSQVYLVLAYDARKRLTELTQ